MVRGIERRSIFRDDEDRARFLKRLQRVLEATGALCLALALMGNHYHLLLEIRGTPLSRVMLRLGTGHALEFNRRHRRSGHLYQNRFKSKILETEEAFRNVLRYIHLNPVRAGMVPDLDALARWPWTGHAGLLGHLPTPFLDAREVLRHFGDDEDEARRAYARWMAGPDGPETADPVGALPADGSEPNLTDSVCLDPRDDQAARRRAGWDLDRAIRAVCASLEVGEAAVRAGRRTKPVRRARAEIAVVAVYGLGLSQAAVARATGVTPQAISKWLLRLAGARGQIVERYLLPRPEGIATRDPAAPQVA